MSCLTIIIRFLFTVDTNVFILGVHVMSFIRLHFTDSLTYILTNFLISYFTVIMRRKY